MAEHMAQQNAEGSRDLSTLVDASAELQHLVQTIWRLRQPDGCPWDREQTHQSIGKNMIEEAYEALDCIEADDAAHLREELGDTFYVTMGMDSCLSIYSDASWARFTEKFESLPYTKTKAMRPLFANAAKCEPDAQGRIVLPQKLRAYAHLEKDVVVIGVSNRAEIWNAEKWAEIEAEELNPENLAAVMEELGF